MESFDLMLIGSLFTIGVSVYLFFSFLLITDNDQQALSWAAGDEPQKSKSKLIELSRPLVHQFGMKLSGNVKNKKYRTSIERKLLTAGLRGELNVDEFIGLQVLWGIIFPVFFIFFNYGLDVGFPFYICLGVAVFGVFFPHMYCNAQKKLRYQSVLIDLPFYVDLLALSTEAGLDFIGAIQKLVEKSKGSVLGEEFSNVLRDLKLGQSRADSLRGLSNRLEMSEMNSFVAMLIDADATGSSISKILKDQSSQMRLERFTRAEKAGAKASQLILIPLVVFILPAVFIIVFGPIGLSFLSGGK